MSIVLRVGWYEGAFAAGARRNLPGPGICLSVR
jgi:hypothetical protein